MSTTDSGRKAESQVATFLLKQKFKIIDRNWRNRWCEIDLVARNKHKVIFVEVKYRRRETWGDGFDAVTPEKLRRMARAAEAWVLSNNWEGGYQLAVARVNEDQIDLRYIEE